MAGIREQERGFTPETLFCTIHGRPWKHYTFSEQLRIRLGKDYIKPHQLRHMVGTLMGEGNLGVDTIQAGLGHQDRSSSDVYVDKTRKMRNTALEVVSAGLKNVDFVEILEPKNSEVADSGSKRFSATISEDGEVTCPCCRCKIIINKQLQPQ